MHPSLVWFRLDLRLGDNPALNAAVQRGRPIIPVFIWSPEEERPWAPGAASRWWLHQSLAALSCSLSARGSTLILRSGPSLAALQRLLRDTKADAVYWSRRYEPAVTERDRQIKDALRKSGVEAKSYNATLLFEPWRIQNKSGKPFQVFTPFWNHCLNAPEPPTPLSAPRQLSAPAVWPKTQELKNLHLEPGMNWANGLRVAWAPGEENAHKQLRRFMDGSLADYADSRNRPSIPGSSRLSPHLHFGEIGPRQVWHAIQKCAVQGRTKGLIEGSDVYLKEIGWREFACHLLHHFPRTPRKPLRGEFKEFPWRKNSKALRLWQKGLTGYPIVDAGMRELWATGWMHNRVRMIAGSFLVKDLLMSWQNGAAWFWDTLVDADLASNTLGWQWVAGCGADAAPYYRVFNPTLQAVKFDPEGIYIKRWIPELKVLPKEYIHEPWTAPASVRSLDYPAPSIDHTASRDRALKAFYALRRVKMK